MKGHERIDWLDTARAYGMFLVFCGHFAERVVRGNEVALPLVKAIYAFHMPLFFVISGYLAREALPPVRRFLKTQAASRLVPVLFFSLILVAYRPIDSLLFGSPSSAWSSLLRTRSFHDWPGFCARLSQDGEAAERTPAQRVWELMPAEARQLAAQVAAGAELTRPQVRGAVDGVNDVLRNRGFYREEVFGDIDLPETARTLLAAGREALTEAQVRELNRALLVAAYPDLVRPDLPRSWWATARRELGDLARGFSPNTPVWFLVALFVVELYHFAGARLVRSTGRLLLALVAAVLIGWWVTRDVALFVGDVWFAREGVLLYGFFLFGLLLRRVGALDRVSLVWVALVASGAAFLLTFDLNQGPWDMLSYVLINLSRHGNFPLFLVSAVAGSVFVLCLARVTPAPRWLAYVGRHTLILMGLNGFFFDFVNTRVARALSIAPAAADVAVYCTLVTLLSMAACMPVVHLLSSYVPQLVGRPRQQGPWLPALVAEDRAE